jgi:urocanate hydratase
MIFYQLHIITTEVTKDISDVTSLHDEDLGYYSSIENVSLAICKYREEQEEYFEEYPEFIQKIYCDEIEMDTRFSDNYVLFFNDKGDFIKRIQYDSVKPENLKFKIGDYVTIFDKNNYVIKVGVITSLPKDDDVYTIYYSVENDFMDHIHINENWIYKVDHIESNELKIKLDKTLKACITDKEYQLIKRENKLNKILKK